MTTHVGSPSKLTRDFHGNADSSLAVAANEDKFAEHNGKIPSTGKDTMDESKDNDLTVPNTADSKIVEDGSVNGIHHTATKTLENPLVNVVIATDNELK